MTSVLIVGGGPSGLLLSNLLTQCYKVDTILLEAQSMDEKFRHPQAHFLNTRTMEILRQEVPNVYRKVKNAMPPVHQWNHFHFGYSCRSGDGENIARVKHPVDRPFQRFPSDANGLLVEDDAHGANEYDGAVEEHPLSQCTVGHLAQHTFSRILYENATAGGADIRFQQRVESVKEDADGLYVATTISGNEFRAPVVMAADGANSRLRQQFGLDWNKPSSQQAIQHLINVHFTTPGGDMLQDNPAMLYSIFHPKLLGMMVCHSPGDYVLQIPFFPPFQTVDDDFSHDRVMEMILGAFGLSAKGDESKVQILSIRPWIMSSLVARQYSSGGIALVGDACHVFPPAGGFGMNTGLQDVHNLAWRLALLLSTGKKKREQRYAQDLRRLLRAYDRERRPIAEQNAALSVRNYQRILKLTEACYLHDQHPRLLTQTLHASPLPITVQRSIFRTLLQTAMMPLQYLKEHDSSYAKHVTSNIRSILRSGGGLPLLFPKWELGFGYDNGENGNDDAPSKNDTLGFQPGIRPGYLMPYVELRELNYHQDEHLPLSMMATNELPSRLRRRRNEARPCFVLLVLHQGSHDTNELCAEEVSGIASELEQEMDAVAAFATVHVVEDSKSSLSIPDHDLVLHDPRSKLRSFVLDQAGSTVVVLIRPDGHVAGFHSVLEIDFESLRENLREDVDRSCGFHVLSSKPTM